jgi:hypothetical protein
MAIDWQELVIERWLVGVDRQVDREQLLGINRQVEQS